MNNTPNPTNNLPSDADDMLDEYAISYTKAQPNRFAAHVPSGGRLVVPEADVAQAFPTAESVNTILRAIVQALPPHAPQPTAVSDQCG